MDTRYKQPSSEALNKFLISLKESKDIKHELVKTLIITFLESLKNLKAPEGDKLFISALICFSENKEFIVSQDVLYKALGISNSNPLNDKQKIIYLACLAKYLDAIEAKPQEDLPKSILCKNDVVGTALAIMDRVSVKKDPEKLNKLIALFKEIPERYNKTPKGFFKKNFGQAEDRPNQLKFIATFSNLISALMKEEAPFDFETLIIAASYYLMFLLEEKYQTRRAGGDLYPLLQLVTKVKHSSQIEPEVQKLYFDELYKFIKTISIEEWEQSRPSDSADFNVKYFVFNRMYDDLPNINLRKNTPRSIPYVIGSSVSSMFVYAIETAKEFAYFKFANDLYKVGVGRNTFIIQLAENLGTYVGAFAGPFGAYFIKPYAIEIGKAAERRAVTFSLTGMLRTTICYLANRNAIDQADPPIYTPNSDPLECLFKLAIVHSKKEGNQQDCEYFESLLTFYSFLPEEMKKQLRDNIQQKPTLEFKQENTKIGSLSS